MNLENKGNTETENFYDVCLISMSEIINDARTLNLAKTLVKINKKVCIVAFGKNKQPDYYKNENIIFFPIVNLNQSNAWKKWLYFTHECKKLIKEIPAKVFWASDFFSLKAAIKFSKFHYAKVFYDSREIYSAIASLSSNPIKQKIQTILEKKWVKNVSKIIVSGELDRDYLQKHFGLDIPYYVIKNYPYFKPAIESNLLQEKLGLVPNIKILIYQGVLLKARGIIKIIECLPKLDNFVFCILGEGSFRKEIEVQAKMIGVEERVFFTGNIDSQKLHEWTCSAHIGVSLIEPVSYSYELALPNKMFEYCMAGIPTLATDLPAMKSIIENYGIGKTVKPDASVEEIIQAILEISQESNYFKYRQACQKTSHIFAYESQENIIKAIFKDELN